MNVKDIHIGNAIQEKMKERGWCAEQLAEKIHCERTNVYDIFKRESIDIKQLIRISAALEYDFYTALYPPQPPAPKCQMLIEIEQREMLKVLSNPAIKFIKIVSE
jgi:transcriptional regulator with XRE-family HTH domain